MFRKSNERLSWEQYFMGIALISAERSKDPKRQVGACIVNSKKRILAIGYNGMPDNIEDSDATWDPETKETFVLYHIGDWPLKRCKHYKIMKQCYNNTVCHAELNAVLNRGANDITDCSLYVTYHPCSNCAKVIIQSGIKKVIYYDIYSEKRRSDGEAASKMLKDANVSLEQYQNSTGVMKIKATSTSKETEKTL